MRDICVFSRGSAGSSGKRGESGRVHRTETAIARFSGNSSLIAEEFARDWTSRSRDQVRAQAATWSRKTAYNFDRQALCRALGLLTLMIRTIRSLLASFHFQVPGIRDTKALE